MFSKRIFILGAGASKAHTCDVFPGIGEFFQRARDLNITCSNEHGLKIKEEYKALHDFIKKHFGLSVVKTTKNLDIEEILTYVEIALQKNSSSALLSINEQLKGLIREVLIKLSHKISHRDPAGESYNQFSDLLDHTDTVITFNWDLLLDNILMSQRGNPRNFTPTRRYADGIQYVNFRSLYAGNSGFFDERSMPAIKQPYSQWEHSSGLYIKAHGSIDWYCCVNQSCRANNVLFIVDNPEIVYYCAECHEQVVNVLVPPVLNKQMNTYSVIRSLWNTAAKEMQTVEHLIIWGYSLPATDYHSKWLLRQARHKHLKKLTIINPAILTKRKRGFTNYKRNIVDMFKGQLDMSSIELYETFSDYVSDIDVLDKYPVLRKRQIRTKSK